MITGMKYFDFDDYDTPIKGVYEDRIFHRLTPTMQKYLRIFLRKSDVTLTDSILPFAGQSHSEFYSVGNTIQDFGNDPTDDGIFFQLQLMQDPILDSYERRVYSILDFSGQLGGFFEVLFIGGG